MYRRLFGIQRRHGAQFDKQCRKTNVTKPFRVVTEGTAKL